MMHLKALEKQEQDKLLALIAAQRLKVIPYF